ITGDLRSTTVTAVPSGNRVPRSSTTTPFLTRPGIVFMRSLSIVPAAESRPTVASARSRKPSSGLRVEYWTGLTNGMDLDRTVHPSTGFCPQFHVYRRSGSCRARRTAGGELLAHPGAELADDGVFVHLSLKQHERRQVADHQARNGPADGAHRVPAIAAE